MISGLIQIRSKDESAYHVYIYIYVCVCMYIYIYVYVYIYIYIQVYIYIYIYTYIHIHIYIYIYIYIYTHTYIYIYIYIYMYMYIYIYMYMYIYVYMYIYIYVYMRINIHYNQILLPSKWHLQQQLADLQMPSLRGPHQRRPASDGRLLRQGSGFQQSFGLRCMEDRWGSGGLSCRNGALTNRKDGLTMKN